MVERNLDSNEAVALLNKSGGIPKDVKSCVVDCHGQGRNNPLLDAIIRDGANAINRFEFLFSQAARVLGVPMEKLPRVAHFNPRDLAPSKFDSFIAELRMVLFLDLRGFSKIRFVPEAGQSRPDLMAEYQGANFIVEVATPDRNVIRLPTEGGDTVLMQSAETLYRVKHGDIHSHLGFFKQTYEKKKAQLAWKPDNLAWSELLIFVINNVEAIATGGRQTYEGILEGLHKSIGAHQRLHFAVVTGMENGITGESDDCIWPPLSKNCGPAASTNSFGGEQ